MVLWKECFWKLYQITNDTLCYFPHTTLHFSGWLCSKNRRQIEWYQQPEEEGESAAGGEHRSAGGSRQAEVFTPCAWIAEQPTGKSIRCCLGNTFLFVALHCLPIWKIVICKKKKDKKRGGGSETNWREMCIQGTLLHHQKKHNFTPVNYPTLNLQSSSSSSNVSPCLFFCRSLIWKKNLSV